MNKYFWALVVFAVFSLSSFRALSFFGYAQQPFAFAAEGEDNVWFPVVLTADAGESYTMYAAATMRYRESVLSRQRAIKLVLDSVPGLTEISKTETAQNDTFQIYRLDWFLVKNLLKWPLYLDTLVAANAFLGFDSEQSILSAYEAERSKSARNAESALPKASRDREGLMASAKADPNAALSAALKESKQKVQAQVRGLNAVYLDAFSNPIFIDTLLLKTFPDESELDCVAKYASRVLVLRNAYPDWFQTLNQNYLSFVNKGDWFGLFNYAKGKLNPLSENHKAYISKYMRAFVANN
jgi:hypothetical protein